MGERLGGFETIETRPERFGRSSSPEAAIEAFRARRYCEAECTFREELREDGLLCPFVAGEDSYQSNAPEAAFVAHVAANTLLHCATDVQDGRDPIVLIDTTRLG
jgi:hypothetical protein